MFLRGEYWHYDFIAGGVRFRGSTGYKKNEKTKAAEVEAKLKVQAREGHSLEMVWEQTKRKLIAGHELALDFASVWDAFLKLSTCNARTRRKKLYASHLRNFCEWISKNHPEIRKISGVMPNHAMEWTNYIRSSPGATATKNDYLGSMRMIFAAIGKESGVVENPFASIKSLTVDQVPRETFTPQELALIGQKATGWIYSLCITAVSTGLREGDICMLLKSSVNLETGWISIPKTRKTGASVDIPILPGLRRHLADAMQNTSDYVYPELARMYIKDPRQISIGIKDFFQRIGIANTTKNVQGYAKRQSTKDIHSFRHTFVYLASVHGIPLPIVQGIVGHASPEMTKHYMDHAGRTEKAQYLARIPDYLTGGASPALPEQKKSARKDSLPERLLKGLSLLTPENLERNRKRLTSLLQQQILLQNLN